MRPPSKLLLSAFFHRLICTAAAAFVSSLVLIVNSLSSAQTDTHLTSNSALPAAPAENSTRVRGIDVNPTENTNSAKQLDELARQRLAQPFDSDYPIGPGDVLEVSVPDMPELRSRIVRVSGINNISLPIVGEIDVTGLTQDQVKRKIAVRLRRYMHDPQVDLFVREYHSRDVAVMGMVQKPGLYSLDSPDETVVDIIGRAGGITDRGANRVLLIPAGEPAVDAKRTIDAGPDEASHSLEDGGRKVAARVTQSNQENAVMPQGPVHVASTEDRVSRFQSDSYSEAQRQRGILIDISGTSEPEVLTLPARPGDLVIVPAAGEVMVQGWVRNPGAFTITPNMTALGAITAAGGEMFSSSAELLRTEQGHHQVDVRLDLGKIRKRTAEDPLIQSGDIVIVNRSAAGAVPYLAYLLFDKLGGGVYGSPF